MSARARSKIVLVDAAAATAESVRQALEAAGHEVERVRTAEEAIALSRGEELVSAHRVESLAALAAGIAHDLNNVLASGLMAIELLAGGPAESPSARLLGALEESVRRAAGLVRQLLWFARGAEEAGAPYQPKHLVTELQKLVAALLPRGSEIETYYPPDLHLLSADPHEVYQLLLGLLRAAWTALPAAGGVLTLAARNARADEAPAEAAGAAQVVFEVRPAPPAGPPEALSALLATLGGTAAPPQPGGGLRVYLPATPVPEEGGGDAAAADDVRGIF